MAACKWCGVGAAKRKQKDLCDECWGGDERGPVGWLDAIAALEAAPPQPVTRTRFMDEAYVASFEA